MQFRGMKLRHAAEVICGVVGHQNLVMMLRLEVSLVQKAFKKYFVVVVYSRGVA